MVTVSDVPGGSPRTPGSTREKAAGLQVVELEDLGPDFARHVQSYFDALTGNHRAAVVAAYGQEMYEAVEQGLAMWRDASAMGQVGRGRIVAKKPA